MALLWQPDVPGALSPGVAGLQVGIAMSAAAPGDRAAPAQGVPDAVDEAPDPVADPAPEQAREVTPDMAEAASYDVETAKIEAPPPEDAALPLDAASLASAVPPASAVATASAVPTLRSLKPVQVAALQPPATAHVTAADTVVPLRQEPEFAVAPAAVMAAPSLPSDIPVRDVVQTAVAVQSAPASEARPATPPLPPLRPADLAPPRMPAPVPPEPPQMARVSPASLLSDAAVRPDPGAGFAVAKPSAGELRASEASASGAGGKAGQNDDIGTSNDTGNQSGGGTPGQQADYLSQLQIWLERHKEYPRRAQRRRQEGTAMLFFRMSRDGQVLDYRIEQSSGHAALDREVEAMIRRAQPLPAMPGYMSQSRLDLVVPIVFAIR